MAELDAVWALVGTVADFDEPVWIDVCEDEVVEEEAPDDVDAVVREKDEINSELPLDAVDMVDGGDEVASSAVGQSGSEEVD